MAEPTTDLVVCGAGGRMGRRIVALAAADDSFRIAGAVEAAAHPDVGRDAGEVAGVGPIGIAISGELEPLLRRGVVVVDFTTPEASLAHLRSAAAARVAAVVGSTGFSAAQNEELDDLARRIPALIAPNMSLGVNVLLSLVEDAVRRLGEGFDCEIAEIHHGRKKDAPSGTALALAEAAARAAGRDPRSTIRLAREGLVGERRPDEIGVFGLRGGDAVGDHTVFLLGNGERLELTHRASSRDCLASGALRAAAWVRDRPPGRYSMRDVVLGHT